MAAIGNTHRGESASSSDSIGRRYASACGRSAFEVYSLQRDNCRESTNVEMSDQYAERPVRLICLRQSIKLARSQHSGPASP